MVGDGGASYRATALRLAMEEAERTGRDVRDVAAERWGSLDSLTRGLSIDEALSFERTHNFKRGRRRGFVLEPARDAAGLSDAQLLKQFATEMQHKKVDLDKVSSKKKKRGENDDDDDDAPAIVAVTKSYDYGDGQGGGGAGWQGLSSRTGFALGKGTFEDGWRDSPRPQQRRVEQPRAPETAPEESSPPQKDAVSNTNVAALLRAKLGGGGTTS